MNGTMDWTQFLDDFGKAMLRRIDVDPERLPTDHNPITDALKVSDFVALHEDMDGFSRIALSRLATICQMAVFDWQEGPEGDGKPKALRRHWYAWYKTHFAQPFARQLGDVSVNAQGIEEVNDRAWAARLSQTYAEMVDSREVTYQDLWVEDASRMMAKNWEALFRGCNIVLCVEKDSLFADFQPAAKALGAKSVYSGKGKSSKAAIEKVLREHFYWTPGNEDRTPLIVLHISDHDYDGEAVIGPTFGEQARRYSDHVYEARVGVKPEDVRAAGYDWEDKWYTVKVSNKGYRAWAEEKGLFLAVCEFCGHQYPVVSTDRWDPESECPEYGGQMEEIDIEESLPHGFEVEAMRTRDYYGLIVNALLQVLPFDYIVRKLREECTADADQAVAAIVERICEENENYQELLRRFEELERIKASFEARVRADLLEQARPRIKDFEHLEDDPEPGEYREHVQEADDWTGPWRPFSKELRTRSLTDKVAGIAWGSLKGFVTEKVW